MATPQELATAIRDEARRVAEEEIAKLVEQRIVPLEKRIQALEEGGWHRVGPR
jgi:hypothetical protein